MTIFWIVVGIILCTTVFVGGVVVGMLVEDTDTMAVHLSLLDRRGRVIERLRRENSGLRAIARKKLTRREEALQAKIDALMLEYCPAEMTEGQRSRWQVAQVQASSGETAVINDAVRA